MRLGKVAINLSYVVDLDDAEMVERATSFIVDDIEYAVKTDTVDAYIETSEDASVSEQDIHPVLTDTGDESP